MAITEEVAHEVITNALALARDLKADLVKEAENPVIGINPILIIGNGDSVEDGGGIAQMVCEDLHPTDALPMMLSDLHKQGHLNNWSWICMVTEAFINPSQGEDLDTYERGSAQKDYEENPFTKVREAMCASLFTFEKDVWGGYQTFVLGDNGEPKFDEVELQEKNALAEGNIPFIFFSFADFCRMKKAENN